MFIARSLFKQRRTFCSFKKMDTKVIGDKDLTEAVLALQKGEVVAFPTGML